MNPSSARLAAIAFALALPLAACKPSGDAQTAAPEGSAATAPAPAGDQVAAQITGAGATFIYPLISKWSDDYLSRQGAQKSTFFCRLKSSDHLKWSDDSSVDYFNSAISYLSSICVIPWNGHFLPNFRRRPFGDSCANTSCL